MNDEYPVHLSVDYPEGPRNRLSVLFRFLLVIPILIVVALSGALLPATGLMIIFRQKYPRWMFDYHLQIRRLGTRLAAYMMLLTDQYPSTDEEQSVHLNIIYPDAVKDLNRFMPLVKWILVIPHIILLIIRFIIALILTFIAWTVIIITGRHPQSLFRIVEGIIRYSERVNAYALLLVTDRYPPFRIGN